MKDDFQESNVDLIQSLTSTLIISSTFLMTHTGIRISGLVIRRKSLPLALVSFVTSQMVAAAIPAAAYRVRQHTVFVFKCTLFLSFWYLIRADTLFNSHSCFESVIMPYFDICWFLFQPDYPIIRWTSLTSWWHAWHGFHLWPWSWRSSLTGRLIKQIYSSNLVLWRISQLNDGAKSNLHTKSISYLAWWILWKIVFVWYDMGFGKKKVCWERHQSRTYHSSPMYLWLAFGTFGQN